MFKVLVLSILCGLSFASDVVDYSLWNEVLQRHLKRGTLSGQGGIITSLVDYDGVAKDSDFHTFIAQLGKVDFSTVQTKDEFYALYMNAYNAFVFQMITNNPCRVNGTAIRSIKEIPDVFTKQVGVFGGRNTSLNQIEATLRNPTSFNQSWSEIQLVHACIVCAGMSCPSLSNNAFNNTGSSVIVQMEIQMRQFLSNDKKGSSLNEQTKKLTLSKIFDWFPVDFIPSVLGYLLPYFPNDEINFIKQNMQQLNSTLSYFDYDWQLNSQSGEAPCNQQ